MVQPCAGNDPRGKIPCRALLTLCLVSLILAGAGGWPSLSAAADNAGTVRLQQMVIDKVNREIRFRAKVALREGILEYLLVGADGKTYESVFQVDGNKPSDLTFALLLIGAEPLPADRFSQILARPNGEALLVEKHGASLLTIDLFTGDRRLDISGFIRCREAAPPPLRWVFTGGGFLPDNRYAGDLEASFIAIWPDPSAPVSLFSTLGNPYRGPYGYEMNADSPALALETIEIVIRRAK